MSWTVQTFPCDHERQGGLTAQSLSYPIPSDEAPRLLGFVADPPGVVMGVRVRQLPGLKDLKKLSMEPVRRLEIQWVREGDVMPHPGWHHVGSYTRMREPKRDPNLFSVWHVFAMGLKR